MMLSKPLFESNPYIAIAGKFNVAIVNFPFYDFDLVGDVGTTGKSVEGRSCGNPGSALTVNSQPFEGADRFPVLIFD